MFTKFKNHDGRKHFDLSEDVQFGVCMTPKQKGSGENTMQVASGSSRVFNSKLEELQQDLHKNLNKISKRFVDLDFKKIDQDLSMASVGSQLNYSGAEQMA